MAPTLYYYPGSPPCRTVLITAKALGIDLNLQNVREIRADVVNMYSPEYLKINPQRKVPALKDEESIICDSHAIITYLASKYGTKDDSLYPKDLHKRAIVDERLHFDSAVVAARLHFLLDMFMSKEIKSVPAAKAKYVTDTYQVLEHFLDGHQWIAGDKITIADFSLVVTIVSLNALIEIDPKVYPKVTAWIKRANDFPCFSTDPEQRQLYEKWYNSLLS